MSSHAARFTSVLAGVAASGLLLAAAPAGAAVPSPTSPVPLPIVFPCTAVWSNVIIGTEDDDDLVGTSANDLIIGLGGDDTIYGDTGDDTIIGGNGDDELAGAAGDDCILGGAGNDYSVLWVYTAPNGTDDTYSASFRYEY
jgi:Ca2+-binding RTX toxin-like protein